MAGLSKSEATRLDALLDRVADGTALPGKDFKHLKGEGVWEVRFRAERRIFRLLYSPQTDGVLVLVGLHFLEKKSQRLPQRAFDTARERLRRWLNDRGR